MLIDVFFLRSEKKPLQIREGMKREDVLWDYKEHCPRPAAEDAIAWAQIAGDVLGFHNASGGIIIFGVDDYYEIAPLSGVIPDSKLFNDQIRKYVGDRIWVSFNRIDCKGGHLGLAIIPPRGISIAKARADAPRDGKGRQYFLALDVCVREGDETKVYRGEAAEKYLREQSVPTSNAEYIIFEPTYRILRPDYERYVSREKIEGELSKSIDDPRCYVSHLTGIGGAGKTSIALSFAIKMYERKKFNYILCSSARDRALGRAGIVETSPSLTSYEKFLIQLTEVLGLLAADLASYTVEEQEELLLGLLNGTRTLLVLDNLETVDDDRIFSFIDRLPVPVRVIATSRVQRIQKSVFPIKYEEAAALVPKKHPERAVIYRELGLLLRQSGMPDSQERAIEMFEVAMQESPNDRICIVALAQTRARLGQWNIVISLLEPLINNDDPETRSRARPLLINAYESTGKMVEAAKIKSMFR